MWGQAAAGGPGGTVPETSLPAPLRLAGLGIPWLWPQHPTLHLSAHGLFLSLPLCLHVALSLGPALIQCGVVLTYDTCRPCFQVR